MKLNVEENIPVSAPRFTNIDQAMLYKFRAWKGIKSLTTEDLFTFFTTPSADRDDFLNTLSVKRKIQSLAFIDQIYR